MTDIPEQLQAARAELIRTIEADEEAAEAAALTAVEHSRVANLGRARLAGIDEAILAYRGVSLDSVRRLVPRRHAEGD